MKQRTDRQSVPSIRVQASADEDNRGKVEGGEPTLPALTLYVPRLSQPLYQCFVTLPPAA